jgi:hypothetical protein
LQSGLYKIENTIFAKGQKGAFYILSNKAPFVALCVCGVCIYTFAPQQAPTSAQKGQILVFSFSIYVRANFHEIGKKRKSKILRVSA